MRILYVLVVIAAVWVFYKWVIAAKKDNRRTRELNEVIKCENTLCRSTMSYSRFVSNGNTCPDCGSEAYRRTGQYTESTDRQQYRTDEKEHR